jgi:hypothetical protein
MQCSNRMCAGLTLKLTPVEYRIGYDRGVVGMEPYCKRDL